MTLSRGDQRGIEQPSQERTQVTVSSSAGGLVGRAIGAYRILSFLGAGGMGEVYLAEDSRLSRRVALKLISTEVAGAPECLKRFYQEARAASAINHPNILVVHDFGEVDGRPFMVTEFVEGETLRRRLSTGALPIRQAVDIALQVTGALAAAHARRIIHRDIKPENVMIRPDGYAKVLDFGLAKLTAIDPDLAATSAFQTRAGIVMGTPAYMSPEQARGGEIDPRTDVWSIGVVLYEMGAGRAPFARDSVIDTLHAVVHDQPAPLVGAQPAAAIDRVIHRALAKQAQDRYDSAEALAQDLRAALALLDSGQLTQVRPTTRLIVLPFRIVRPDPKTDFLAFSLADAITCSLSGMESLVVRSTAAALRFAADVPDLARIASEAEVDMVLTGTLLSAGQAVRVTTQLVEAHGGKLVWSHTSQTPLQELFELQDDLTRRIVDALPAAMRDQRGPSDVPASSRAYELYLRANQIAYEERRWADARDLYLRCLAEDSRFAPAWARLGRCHRVIGKWSDEPMRHFGLAEEAFKRALELNPDLSLAHSLYAQVEVDLGRAQEAMLRLVVAAQGSADPELYAGLVRPCRFCGLLEASVAAHEHATRLDPGVFTGVGQTFWMMGDHTRALTETFGDIGYLKGVALLSLGRQQESVEHLRAVEHAAKTDRVRTYLVTLRTLAEGARQESLDAIDRAAAGEADPEALYYLVRSEAYLGETERALAGMRRVVDMGFFCYPLLLRDPWLDPLRASDAFNQALRDAEAGHREAAARFAQAGGPRTLGLRSSW